MSIERAGRTERTARNLTPIKRYVNVAAAERREACDVNKKRDVIDFEKSLRELESLVERMESGDLSLEQSMKDFERGIALTRACQKALAEAEQKVKILLSRDGNVELAPFAPSETNDTENNET